MSEKIEHIARTAVTSSNVKSIGYCPVTKRVHVEYKDSVYAYDDCTPEEFHALVDADKTDGKSVGSLIHKTIKPKKFTKL